MTITSEYFYESNGQRVGPISGQQLRQHFVDEALNEQTLIWTAGTANWQRLIDSPIFAEWSQSPPPARTTPARERTLSSERILHIHRRWKLLISGGSRPNAVGPDPLSNARERDQWLRKKWLDLELDYYDVIYTTERMLFIESEKLKGLAKLKDPRESGWLALGIGLLAYETARALAEKFSTDREYQVQTLDAIKTQLGGEAISYASISAFEIVRLRRLLTSMLFTDFSVPHVLRIVASPTVGSRTIVEVLDASPIEAVREYLAKFPFKHPPTLLDSTA